MPRILLTHSRDELATRFDDEALAALRALGEVRMNEGGAILTTDDLVRLAQGCDLVVADRLTPIAAAFLARAPDVAAVFRSAVDIRNIDVDAASAAGVLVTHASPLFVDAVAELTFGLILDLARGISASVAGYRAGAQPEATMGLQLAGSCLGVVGYGAIGRRVADLGLAFGMEVLVCDPLVEPDRKDLERVAFDDLLARADVVICLAVSVPQTDRMFDQAAFARMKPAALFVNVARGPLVDDEALLHALATGEIAGAALDVGNEPGQMPRLDIAGLPNVIATPHVGGLTRQAVRGQALETVGQVAELLAGRIPHGALNQGALNASAATRIGRLLDRDRSGPDRGGQAGLA